MKKPLAGLLLLAVLLLAAGLSFGTLRPAEPLPASAPAGEFSAARAMELVEKLAVKPHPMGSAEHQRVREDLVARLRALGLEPEVQETLGHSKWTNAVALVRNVIARLPGTAGGPGTKAVVLMAHYDSVPSGPGAADDMASVGALVETLRALKAGPALRNDVLLVITDAEEVGLAGAEAFLRAHPAAKDVGVVLNFEARGTRGPALMFETGANNGWALEHFAQAVAQPKAFSYSYEVYRRLPNDTDFTVFREVGLAGLNFAFIHGAVGYHSQEDSLERLHPASVQDHGAQALALARQFGNADLSAPRPAGDAVYFSLPGGRLVHYGVGRALPLAGLAALLVVAALILGFMRRQYRLAGLVRALGFHLLFLALVAGLAYLAAGLLFPVPYNFRVWSDGSSVAWGVASIALIVCGIAYLVDGFWRRRVGGFALAGAAAVIWLGLTLVVSALAPGASYLFTWPLLAQALALLALAFARPALPAAPAPLEAGAPPAQLRPAPALTVSWWAWAASAVAAVITLTIWLPTLSLVAVGLLTRSVLPVVVLVVLVVQLLTAQWDLVRAARFSFVVPTLMIVVGMVLSIGLSARSRFGIDSPRPSTLLYALDADRGEARWVSHDRRLSDWVRRVLPGEPQRVSMVDFLGFETPLATGPAPLIDVPRPELQVVSVAPTAGGGRRFHLRPVNHWTVGRMRIRVESTSDLVEVRLGDRVIERMPGVVFDRKLSNRRWFFFYAPPADGFDLYVETVQPAPLQVTLIPQQYGLPDVPGGLPGPRPEDSMPSPFEFDSDSVLVRKAFTVSP